MKSPRREGDPTELVANCAQATEKLKWFPQYADIKVIVSTAFKWHANQNNKSGNI